MSTQRVAVVLAAAVLACALGASFNLKLGSSRSRIRPFRCFTDAHCSGNGTCVDGDCRCSFGYSGSTCDTVCPGATVLDNGTITAVCNGRGTCLSALRARCRCAEGYRGRACEYVLPEPPPVTNSSVQAVQSTEDALTIAWEEPENANPVNSGGDTTGITYTVEYCEAADGCDDGSGSGGSESQQVLPTDAATTTTTSSELAGLRGAAAVQSAMMRHRSAARMREGAPVADASNWKFACRTRSRQCSLATLRRGRLYYFRLFTQYRSLSKRVESPSYFRTNTVAGAPRYASGTAPSSSSVQPTSAVVSLPVPQDIGGGPVYARIRSYVLQYRKTAVQEWTNTTVLPSDDAGNATHTLSGLDSATGYTVRAVAVNVVGESGPSDTHTFTTATCAANTNGPSCQYSRSSTCSGRGSPSYSGVCTCDTGYSGSDCGSCASGYYGIGGTCVVEVDKRGFVSMYVSSYINVNGLATLTPDATHYNVDSSSSFFTRSGSTWTAQQTGYFRLRWWGRQYINGFGTREIEVYINGALRDNTAYANYLKNSHMMSTDVMWPISAGQTFYFRIGTTGGSSRNTWYPHTYYHGVTVVFEGNNRPAWSGGCSSQPSTTNSWLDYCLTSTDFDNTQSFMTIGSSEITINVAGYYRVNARALTYVGSSSFYQRDGRILVNNIPVAYTFTHRRYYFPIVNDVILRLNKDDVVKVQYKVQSGAPSAQVWNSWSSSGQYSRVQISFENTHEAMKIWSGGSTSTSSGSSWAYYQPNYVEEDTMGSSMITKSSNGYTFTVHQKAVYRIRMVAQQYTSSTSHNYLRFYYNGSSRQYSLQQSERYDRQNSIDIIQPMNSGDTFYVRAYLSTSGYRWYSRVSGSGTSQVIRNRIQITREGSW